MSIRIKDNVYITPTTFIKHFFTVEDIVTIDLQGNKLAGHHQASSEIKMHLKIYQTREDIRSIFHAHPKYSLLCAINNIKIDTRILPESYSLLEEIAYLPYKQPGTEHFAQSFIEKALEGCNVFVLENHGVTTCGKSIETAFSRLEILENCAYIAIMQKLMNIKPNIIPFLTK